MWLYYIHNQYLRRLYTCLTNSNLQSKTGRDKRSHKYTTIYSYIDYEDTVRVVSLVHYIEQRTIVAGMYLVMWGTPVCIKFTIHRVI